MPLLMEAAPGFDESWRKHLEWWGDKDRGDFIDVSEFASYLVESFSAGTTLELRSVFATVERILQDGHLRRNLSWSESSKTYRRSHLTNHLGLLLSCRGSVRSVGQLGKRSTSYGKRATALLRVCFALRTNQRRSSEAARNGPTRRLNRTLEPTSEKHGDSAGVSLAGIKYDQGRTTRSCIRRFGLFV
jgi:hypothetical protein